MRTARNLRRQKIRNQKKPFRYILLLELMLFIVIAGTLIFKAVKTTEWDGKTKLVLTQITTENNISLVVLDPEIGKIYKYKLPGDAMIETSRGYGDWRIKSLYKLGVDENIGGLFVAESLKHHFNIPSYLWIKTQGQELDDLGLGGLAAIKFKNKTTNLSFGDLLAIKLFFIQTKPARRSVTDLEDSYFFKKEKLTDGEEGYVFIDYYKGEFISIFSDPLFVNGSYKIILVDKSSDKYLPVKIGGVIETLGTKVASVYYQNIDEALDCLITGKDISIVSKLSKVFGCKKNVLNKASGDSTEVVFGELFRKRY